MWKDNAPLPQGACVQQILRFFEIPDVQFWAYEQRELLQGCSKGYRDNMRAQPQDKVVFEKKLKGTPANIAKRLILLTFHIIITRKEVCAVMHSACLCVPPHATLIGVLCTLCMPPEAEAMTTGVFAGQPIPAGSDPQG